MATQTTIRVNEIVIPISQDPKRAKRGDMKALKADIDANGMLTPILVTKDHILLDGARRLSLFRSEQLVDVLEVSSINEMIDLMEKDKHPLQLPFDPRRLFDLHMAMTPLRTADRAELARGLIRARVEGVKLPKSKYPKGYNPTRRRISALVGRNSHQVQTTVYVYTRAMGIVPVSDEDRVMAQQLAERLDAGVWMSSKHSLRRIQVGERKSSDMIRRPGAQRKLMQDALPVLRSVSRGFNLLTDLSDQISPEEASTWLAEANTARTALNRAIRKIKERIERV